MLLVMTAAGPVILDVARDWWWPAGDATVPGEPMCGARAVVGEPLTVLVPDSGGPIGIRLVVGGRVSEIVET